MSVRWFLWRPLLGVLVLLAAALFSFRMALRSDREVLIPTPDRTVKHFVELLKLHYYDGALDQVTEDLRGHLHAADLKVFNESLERQGRRIDQVKEAGSEATQDEAIGQVEVKFANRDVRLIALPLRFENGLWKVASITPLRQIPHAPLPR